MQYESSISVRSKRVKVQANSEPILTGITVAGELNLELNSYIRITHVNIEKANLEIFFDGPQKKKSYINFGENVT